MYVKSNPVNIVDPLGLQAIGDFLSEFSEEENRLSEGENDMEDAGTIGADKYFHCRAMCEATREEEGGKAAAVTLGDFREDYQEILDKLTGNNNDRQEDEVANRQGINHGADPNSGSCYEGCKDLISPSIRHTRKALAA